MSYADNKAWRQKYPDRRHGQKAPYRLKTGAGTAANRCEPWTDEHDELVRAHAVPDSRLSVLIGRSVGAIQHRRTRLRKLDAGLAVDDRWNVAS